MFKHGELSDDFFQGCKKIDIDIYSDNLINVEKELRGNNFTRIFSEYFNPKTISTINSIRVPIDIYLLTADKITPEMVEFILSIERINMLAIESDMLLTEKIVDKIITHPCIKGIKISGNTNPIYFEKFLNMKTVKTYYHVLSEYSQKISGILESSHINSFVSDGTICSRKYEDEKYLEFYFSILRKNKRITIMSLDMTLNVKFVNELVNKKNIISICVRTRNIIDLLSLIQNNNFIEFKFKDSNQWYNFTTNEINIFNERLVENKSIIKLEYPRDFHIKILSKNIISVINIYEKDKIHVEKRNKILKDIMRRRVKRKFFN
jgi:hypothetical protein